MKHPPFYLIESEADFLRGSGLLGIHSALTQPFPVSAMKILTLYPIDGSSGDSDEVWKITNSPVGR
jgi:hypothetical protein